MTVRVFLGGEGNTELGDERGSLHYPSSGQEGVVVALARRQVPDGWEVCGAQRWKDIRKLRAHGLSRPEMQNVAGLALEASEAKADVLCFLRDDDADEDRAKQILEAIASVQPRHPELCIIGGIPRRNLEAWILAIAGETGVEQLGKKRLQELLASRNLDTGKNVRAYVELVEQAPDPGKADAPRLVAWLRTVQSELGRLVRERA
jgi:hypothetical protein